MVLNSQNQRHRQDDLLQDWLQNIEKEQLKVITGETLLVLEQEHAS